MWCLAGSARVNWWSDEPRPLRAKRRISQLISIHVHQHLRLIRSTIALAPAAYHAVATMSTKSADVESRDNSPDRDGSPGKRTSKKRKVLSCFACRNRKMKCDRVYPVCGRCQKTGRGYQCTYDPRLLEDLVGPSGATASGVAHSESGHNYSAAEPTSLDSLQWKIRCQDKRILELEQALSVGKHAKAPSQYHHVQPHTPNEKEQMMFRGKGFKTSFHGATSVMSTIAQV